MATLRPPSCRARADFSTNGGLPVPPTARLPATPPEQAKGWAVGLDWTLQKQIRVLVDYETTTFDGLGAKRPDEKVLFTRVQIGW